jgi:hypothetical protein
VLATRQNKPPQRSKVKPNRSVVQQNVAACLPESYTFNACVLFVIEAVNARVLCVIRSLFLH